MEMDSRASAVLDSIDVDELVKVALDLGNIDSPTGSEGPVGDYVYDWLNRQGFAAKKVVLFPDRPNVIATLPGSGPESAREGGLRRVRVYARVKARPPESQYVTMV